MKSTGYPIEWPPHNTTTATEKLENSAFPDTHVISCTAIEPFLHAVAEPVLLQHSSAGIATRYGLGGPGGGFESWQGHEIFFLLQIR